MKPILADLHIHTALSPCASEEMTPPAIVRTALARGLAMVAICDHNSAGNVLATQQAAADLGTQGLTVLAGIEIETKEEIHVLGLFPDAESAGACGQKVMATLPLERRRGRKGKGQYLMDSEGRRVGVEPRMLSTASTFSLEGTVSLIKEHGGLAIAAHVDRPSFSVTSQLGMFPAQAGFDAIEVFGYGNSQEAENHWRALGLPIVHSSDSHFLADIAGRHTRLEMRSATFEELRSAMARNEGILP